MTRRLHLIVAIAYVALAGCGEPTADSGMPGMSSSQTGGQHAAQGTVNSIDRTEGTINISHGPVESAGWPAMTMNFKLADPDSASGVQPGQAIEFRFTMDGTVTAIGPAN